MLKVCSANSFFIAILLYGSISAVYSETIDDVRMSLAREGLEVAYELDVEIVSLKRDMSIRCIFKNVKDKNINPFSFEMSGYIYAEKDGVIQYILTVEFHRLRFSFNSKDITAIGVVRFYKSVSDDITYKTVQRTTARAMLVRFKQPKKEDLK